MPKDCIRTNSGLFMNVFEPTVDMLCIEDIAHALSQQPRFAGHLDRPYSVAQHSVMCSQLVKKRKNKLPALLHDGSEAYLLDIPTPIKARMFEYKEIEHHLMSVIAEKFKFDYPYDAEIKEVDTKMLHLEWENLVIKKNLDFVCLSPAKAKALFLKTYYQLIKEEKWKEQHTI